MTNQTGLFDLQDRLNSLTKAGDPLTLLNEKIDWSKFKPLLLIALQKSRKSNAGRKPFPPILIFKILILQSLYNLSDEQMEFQIKDRLSFMRFLELNFEDRVPDQKTIWHYREIFTDAGVITKLFNKFDKMLQSYGLVAAKGTLIDASIIEAPRQRNTREENKQIKEGSVPEEWKENEAKLCQKDTDARWVTKNGKNSYGYKMHTNVDNKHKLIRKVIVTPASTHDSQVFQDLLVKNTSKTIWADSAYAGHKKNLPEGYRDQIHSKGSRKKLLSEFQNSLNYRKSKIRCRVEHVFGTLKGSMKLAIRSVGIKRAETRIFLTSLAYNMMRGARLVH